MANKEKRKKESKKTPKLTAKERRQIKRNKKRDKKPYECNLGQDDYRGSNRGKVRKKLAR